MYTMTGPLSKLHFTILPAKFKSLFGHLNVSRTEPIQTYLINQFPHRGKADNKEEDIYLRCGVDFFKFWDKGKRQSEKDTLE